MSKIQNPKSKIQNRLAFSLTEVLIAVAILTIALVMVGASFPVGVAMTANVAERTTAAVVADEAFAKIKLYGVNLASGNWNKPKIDGNEGQIWVPFEEVAATLPVPLDEFAYPSDPAMIASGESVYYWSALCRKEPDNTVRVVVFVSRKAGQAALFPHYSADPLKQLSSVPQPVLIYRKTGPTDYVLDAGNNLLLTIIPNSANLNFTIPSDTTKLRNYLNPGCFVLDDSTGEIYRIIERTETVATGAITLDRTVIPKNFDPTESPSSRSHHKVWVVPPAVGSGRNPCIAVYQKVIKF
jgi:hypothetical protein